MALIIRVFAVMVIGWAAILTIHWTLLEDPRWLVVLHTIVFALTVGMWLAASVFVTWMQRRRDDVFGEGDET